MDEFETLSHTKWERKYHIVFIPKYRRKVLYGELTKGPASEDGQHEKQHVARRISDLFAVVSFSLRPPPPSTSGTDSAFCGLLTEIVCFLS